MNPGKCVNVIVQPLDAVGPTTAEDVLKLQLQHQCECGEAFASVWALRGHKIACHTLPSPNQEWCGCVLFLGLGHSRIANYK
eukprot:SAG31_NODE_3386_length_4331_cov_2.421786_1_plen_82_part_00